MDSIDFRVVVLLNLSRDQIDRMAEVRSNAVRWRAALTATHGVTVVANADDPIVAHAVPDGVAVVWVAAGMRWRWDAMSCPACGGRIDYATRAALGLPPVRSTPARARRHHRRRPGAPRCRDRRARTWTCPVSTSARTPRWRSPPHGCWVSLPSMPRPRSPRSRRSTADTARSGATATPVASSWPRTRPAGWRCSRCWTRTSRARS